MLHSQMEKNNEDFNNFILAYKESKKIRKQKKIKDRIMGEHLTTLKKHMEM